jgi:peptidyl-dipeptidase A
VNELDAIVERLRPLEEERNVREWDLYAEVTDENEAAAVAANVAYETALADPELRTRSERVAAQAATPYEERQAVLLDLQTRAAQRPPELRAAIIELEAALASRFSAYRAEYNGRALSDNEVDEVLLRSQDVEERRAVWESARAVGAEVCDDLRRLVHLRNDAARRIGYRDHYALALETSEVSEDWLLATLDDLAERIAPAFRAERDAIDGEIRARFAISASDPLYPWHYTDRFFQEPPPPDRDPLDDLVGSLDVVDVARRYFRDLGHDVDGVLARSDLYPRERKHEHAFAVAIVRGEDIRISCNIEPTERWFGTTLHELGHAVYDIELDPGLPWLLREQSHLLTTEAIALLHGAIIRDPVFLERYAGASPELARDPAHATIRRRGLLVFAQWVQVMVRFERALYADPDADLATIWWDIAERHQLLTRPPGPRPHDWASKVHLCVAPVYYHNYLLGELTVAQLGELLGRETGSASPAVHPELAGPILTTRYMRPGASLRWDALTERATGAPLSADAFVRAVGG